jgi:hypothetical protein
MSSLVVIKSASWSLMRFDLGDTLARSLGGFHYLLLGHTFSLSSHTWSLRYPNFDQDHFDQGLLMKTALSAGLIYCSNEK